jgi:hypothetical protein
MIHCSLLTPSGPEHLVYVFEFSVDSSCSFEQHLANSGHPLLSLVATVTGGELGFVQKGEDVYGIIASLHMGGGRRRGNDFS